MTLIDEDEALIAAALKGSAYAWEKLVKRYEGKIYNYGLRLTGNATDAMDLMQEVFLGIYRNLHRFRGDAKFSSWIYRIAHNKAVDMNRRKRLFTNLSKSDDQPASDEFERLPSDPAYQPDSRVHQGQANQQVQKMLGKLTMDQRLVVELKIYQSQTFEEIAGMQEISINTAKTRFYSALKKLKIVAEENHVLS
jgi:RNA polymerase sigma-70 factor (ECF subfamily)|tara:strand:+ start:372 stop:953 length:582 start_codon:yes stop_codon:yes gene_type:complete